MKPAACPHEWIDDSRFGKRCRICDTPYSCREPRPPAPTHRDELNAAADTMLDDLCGPAPEPSRCAHGVAATSTDSYCVHCAFPALERRMSERASERDRAGERPRYVDVFDEVAHLTAENANLKHALEQIAGRPMSALDAHNIARRALGLEERVVADATLAPGFTQTIEFARPTAAYEPQRDRSHDDELFAGTPPGDG
jgi:hypothetical protein